MDVSPGSVFPPSTQPPLGGAPSLSIPADRTGINDASGAVWALPPASQASAATRGNAIMDLKQMLTPHAFVTFAAYLIDALPNDQFSLVLCYPREDPANCPSVGRSPPAFREW